MPRPGWLFFFLPRNLQIPGHFSGEKMQPGWIAIIVAVFVGFYLGVIAMALMAMAGKSCDHFLPDIEDVKAE
jgi:hypothetical protein